MSGTSNIALIRGRFRNHHNVAINLRKAHLAVDYRTTRMYDDGPRITGEHHPKLVTLSEEHNVHMTLCGGMKCADHMLDTIRGGEKSLEVYATDATTFLRDITNAKQPEDLIDGCTLQERDIWREKTVRWTNKYKNTCGFLCGFEEEVPKILLVNSRYEVPLDISLDFSEDQVNKGITSDMATQAVAKRGPHFMVRGSYSNQLTDYIEASDFFQRIKREYAEDIEDLPCEADVISDDDINYELSKAIVIASMKDNMTGGDFYVRTMIFGEEAMSFAGNVIHFYMDNFAAFGERDSVLLVRVEFREYNASNVAAVNSFIWSFIEGEPQLKIIGIGNSSYVYFRLKFDSKEGVDPPGVAFIKLSRKCIKTDGNGELLLFEPEGFNILVGKPTEYVRKMFRE